MKTYTHLTHNRFAAEAYDRLTQIRESLEEEFHTGVQAPSSRLVQLALNEAEAVAWDTGFPALVFPALAEEKLAAVAEWHARQQTVRQTFPELAFAA